MPSRRWLLGRAPDLAVLDQVGSGPGDWVPGPADPARMVFRSSRRPCHLPPYFRLTFRGQAKQEGWSGAVPHEPTRLSHMTQDVSESHEGYWQPQAPQQQPPPPELGRPAERPPARPPTETVDRSFTVSS